MRASTETELMTLHKFAMQTHASQRELAGYRGQHILSRASSSTRSREKNGKLQERRRKAQKSISRKINQKFKSSSKSHSCPPLALVVSVSADVDMAGTDIESRTSETPIEEVPTELAAAALVAAAELACRSDVSPSTSTGSECNTALSDDDSEMYNLHLGRLPNPIDGIRSELVNPSELRFVRLPFQNSVLVPREARARSASPSLASAPTSSELTTPSMHTDKEPETTDEFNSISLRDLEKDWDEWRWESMQTAGDLHPSRQYRSHSPSLFLPSQSATFAVQA